MADTTTARTAIVRVSRSTRLDVAGDLFAEVRFGPRHKVKHGDRADIDLWIGILAAYAESAGVTLTVEDPTTR